MLSFCRDEVGSDTEVLSSLIPLCAAHVGIVSKPQYGTTSSMKSRLSALVYCSALFPAAVPPLLIEVFFLDNKNVVKAIHSFHVYTEVSNLI